MESEIFGEALDGTKFNAESPEVVSYMTEYPDVSLEAAIGSVVLNHNNGGSMPVSEVEVSEESSDQAADDVAEASNEAAAEDEASDDESSEEEVE